MLQPLSLCHPPDSGGMNAISSFPLNTLWLSTLSYSRSTANNMCAMSGASRLCWERMRASREWRVGGGVVGRVKGREGWPTASRAEAKNRTVKVTVVM